MKIAQCKTKKSKGVVPVYKGRAAIMLPGGESWVVLYITQVYLK